jgi:hypothetical protein
MKSIMSLLSIIALGVGLLSCSDGGGGGGGGTSATPTTAANFGVVGNSYFSLLSTNTLTPPVTWTVLGGIPLPAGLALTSATGAVSGIPTVAGNSTVTFSATDSTGKTETISVLFAIHPRTDPVSIDNSTPPVPGGGSSSPSISDDGRFVAFASSATLIPGVGGSQIYIHDWQTNQTSLVSRNDVGTAGNGASSQPTISSNGRFVAFTSASSNLTTDLNPALSQIFLRDTVGNGTSLVSKDNSSPSVPGNGLSNTPSVSGNGGFVAFSSVSTNLGATGGGNQIYVRALP